MIHWLEPWVAVADFGWPADRTATYQNDWELQLKREVCPSHVLFERPAKLIARRFDKDDALFLLPDDSVAEVHLTWSRGVEPDPQWPETDIFESLEAWANQSMAMQHRDWAAD